MQLKMKLKVQTIQTYKNIMYQYTYTAYTLYVSDLQIDLMY